MVWNVENGFILRKSFKEIQLLLAGLGHFLSSFENTFWLRITDEGSVSEMRIWSILLIKSNLKWCIYLSRSLFLHLHESTEVDS